MDRIDAMTAFVAAVDLAGFSAAARKLGRSPASITRAVAFLEARVGAELLRRTTRSVKLTEAGARYVAACRRILAELGEAEEMASEERASPRGALVVSAPAAFGRLHVRPLVDAFLGAHEAVTARLVLVDRLVNLVDEGVDVAVRIAHLPDSALRATKVGEVRRVVCASPAYLAKRGTPREPAELAGHATIAFSQVTATEAWVFASGGKRVQVKVRPRLTVNAAEAAVASAVEGNGITCVLSYQVQKELAAGRLVRLLASFEPDPLPVHVVYPETSAATPKVRAFVDLASKRLKAALAKV